jgi:serine/threonine protein kinase
VATQTTNCPRCSKPLQAGARFCPSCGSDVSGEQTALATAKIDSAAPRPHRPSPSVTRSEAGLIETLRKATLGDYEIMGLLGRGGMATVYLAHDIALDRKVAIKVMAPHLMSGEGMAERFKREARTAGSLSHPHIIPIYAVEEAGDDLLFFVMKFVEGRPLDGIIREVGAVPFPMVQSIMQQVGSALGYAHRRGIIHRDIKPANIMLDVDGWAVVTDFGIAKVSDKQGLTMTGATVGTPSYMSPEQCAATKELAPASDQYSLGIVAYEMLAGRLPFAADSVMAIMYAHFNETPAPIQSMRADCPPVIAEAVMRMLEKDPAKRWPNVEAAVAAFGAAPLASDDPVRTKMMTLATQGGNSQLLAKFSTPASPTPVGRARTAADKTATGVVSLVLTPPQVAVAVHGAVQLTARPKRASGATLVGRAITWASTEPDVATVSEDGLVTALKPGVATITCTCEGSSATATVTVTTLKKSRALAYVVGLIVIAGLGAGAWFFGPWNKPASPAPPSSQTASQPAAPPPSAQPPDHPVTNGNASAGGGNGPLREERREGAAALREDAAIRGLRANVRNARERAVNAGATPADLTPGEEERRIAELLAAQGRLREAAGHLRQAVALWGSAEQTAVRRGQQGTVATQPAAPPPAPVAQTVPPAATNPPPAAPENPRPLIDAAVQGYARALESRDVQQVRRAYPGLTPAQAQVWRDFFSSVSDLKVDLAIKQLQFTGDVAEAQVEGTSQYTQNRRSQTQPMSFHATLDHSSGTWRLASVR